MDLPMSDHDRYHEANRISEWLKSQAGRVPRPLSEEDLQEIEQRAARSWTEASPDLLRLVAEVRGLRSLVHHLQAEQDER
jgi:hypothetical protein